MTSIRDEAIAIDTNVWIFALRKEPTYPACETLLFDKLPDLQIYIPLQIFLELQRNLTAGEMRRVVLALRRARTVTWDYTLARLDLVRPVGATWGKEGRCRHFGSP